MEAEELGPGRFLGVLGSYIWPFHGVYGFDIIGKVLGGFRSTS